MLNALNIPNATPTELPSAQPGAPAESGQANGFAQMLRQAKSDSEPAPEPARGKPPAAKAQRGDTPTRGAARAGHEPSEAEAPALDAAGGQSEDKTLEIEPSHGDQLAALKTTVDATTTDETKAGVVDGAAASPGLLPPVQRAVQPVAAAPDAAPGSSAEPRDTGRIGQRPGEHDLKASPRAEAGVTTPVETTSARDMLRDLSRDSTPGQPQVIEQRAALDVAAGASARAAPAPAERSPLETTPPAAAAIHGARDLAALAIPRAEAAAATLRAPLDHPGFAPALGAQVALWVRDGVQQARLQLHPAELGPVSVQIALDGKAAHVDFIAAVATTRDSIEQSLPALAAALRESGFTLTGGGVFGRSGQGAGEPDSRQRAPGHRGPRMAVNDVDAATPAPRRWARSLLDVYA